MVLQLAVLLLAAGLQLLTDVKFLSYHFGNVRDAALEQSIIFVLLKISPINWSSTLDKPSCALTAALQMKASSFLLHRHRYLAWLEHPCINRKYNHKRYFWSFLSVISEGLLAAQLARLAFSPFYFVILNNSNDIGNENHYLIFLM
ncbi:hypothetical protein AXG93_4031s1160 [Marchantia polymorpha subsp. ruderalis]|uniref:ABC transmembrane type-1 domain-containing protein n=1 Tax=Marchantia polymorpha subsp. ruderalis TaxID=1480154 RepID=A0A176WFK4_MARPO|nr:hypothetical protein AXG93_4031s1160 [Marchantia polymorpha subsp. ruderalis]